MGDDHQADIESEPGSGNVFADLGLEDAGELFARAQLGLYVHKLIAAKELKQREIASLLGIKQPEVSHLMLSSPVNVTMFAPLFVTPPQRSWPRRSLAAKTMRQNPMPH